MSVCIVDKLIFQNIFIFDNNTHVQTILTRQRVHVARHVIPSDLFSEDMIICAKTEFIGQSDSFRQQHRYVFQISRTLLSIEILHAMLRDVRGRWLYVGLNAHSVGNIICRSPLCLTIARSMTGPLDWTHKRVGNLFGSAHMVWPRILNDFSTY